MIRANDEATSAFALRDVLAKLAQPARRARTDELETAALNQQAKFIANIFPARS